MSSREIGTKDRPLHIAIVGSGPAGFYAVGALFAQKSVETRIDMFDRLPTPYGLARGGVAPDHEKIKSVTKLFERSASHPNFRFFGNVALGRDIQVEDLARHYDQIVYAVGNEADRPMRIKGEDLEGVTAATVFVGWYNGHPDYRDANFDLSAEHVAVVGIGNVAVDVTRILGRNADELVSTDIAEHALRALRGSKVKEITMLGRRGPVQAAFTPAELREMGHLEGSDVVVDAPEMEFDELSQASLKKSGSGSQYRKNTDILREYSERAAGTKPRKIRFRFLVSPVECIGENGKVKKVRIEKNELYLTEGGVLRPRGTGVFETIDADMVLVSIGYQGIPIPGVPFNEKGGIISNDDGRVTSVETGEVIEGQYVVGWAQSGPKGLIGSHKAGSAGVVKVMLEDVAAGKTPTRDVGPLTEVDALLQERQINYVTLADWKILEQVEINRGKRRGAPRVKFTDIDDMLSAMGKREDPHWR